MTDIPPPPRPRPLKQKRGTPTPPPKSRAADPVRPKRTLKQARQYLSTVLSMDPMYRSADMVELRWNYCGFAPPKSVAAKADDTNHLRDQRAAAENRLENIRANFWTADPVELKSALDGLDVSKFPELKAGARRLQRILSQIGIIQALGAHEKTEVNLYNTFRRIIMMPSKPAGRLKEKYLRSLAGSSAQRKVRKMVAMMRTDFPTVFEIESDWFEQISRSKLKGAVKEDTSKRDYSYEDGGGGGGSWLGLSPFAICFIAWMIFKIAIVFFR